MESSLHNTKLILASSSPRRKELLKQIGLEFEVITSDCDETVSDMTEPSRVVEELSGRKAEAVAEKILKDRTFRGLSERIIVLGADTLVSLKGQIMGKPENEEDAFRFLKLLQGNVHFVDTGVTLILCGNKGGMKRKTFHERSEVCFYPMTDSEIRGYIATGEPMDKAGAYGIQGIFARNIASIRGSYTNIVGLPLGRTWQELKGLM